MRKGKERESGFYDVAYTRRKYSTRNKSIWRIVFGEFLQEPTHILDLGCGDGVFAMLCLERGHTYVGVDFSPVAIDNARLKTPEAEYCLVDLREDQSIVMEGDYDVVVAIEFFEHIHEDLGVIEAIPSGKRVVFSVPDFWSKDHVRVFKQESDIVLRYENLLDIKKILTVVKRTTTKKFVVDSVKR